MINNPEYGKRYRDMIDYFIFDADENFLRFCVKHKLIKLRNNGNMIELYEKNHSCFLHENIKVELKYFQIVQRIWYENN